MSKFSRDKGKRYERKIARALRQRFPELSDEIRRSIQSRQAEESDVTGLPDFWLECQDAQTPTPLKKLQQAERDVSVNGLNVIPVAITHKTRSKDHSVTMRLPSLMSMLKNNGLENAEVIVTISFADFLELVEQYYGDKKDG
jgi:hypothetical protein